MSLSNYWAGQSKVFRFTGGENIDCSRCRRRRYLPDDWHCSLSACWESKIPLKACTRFYPFDCYWMSIDRKYLTKLRQHLSSVIAGKLSSVNSIRFIKKLDPRSEGSAICRRRIRPVMEEREILYCQCRTGLRIIRKQILPPRSLCSQSIGLQTLKQCSLTANRRSQAYRDFSCVRNMNFA